jgi:hypothetical protein
MAGKIVLFLALLLVGLTSGAAVAVWLDSNPSGMSPGFYAEEMQHAITVFMVPLNAIAILGVLFTVAATFLARRDPLSLYLLIAASVCAITATLITFFGSVPIINQIMTWNANAPPSNWLDVGNKWWWFQTIRTIVVITELSLIIGSVLVHRDTSK